MTSAMTKLQNHLNLAVRLLVSGEPEQVVKGREVLTFFLKKFPDPLVPPPKEDSLGGLAWWPSVMPTKPSEDPRASQPQPAEGWFCFHCQARFHTFETAKAHFETAPNNTPACLVTPRDRSLYETLLEVQSERDYLDSMLDVIKVIETKFILKKE